MEWHLVRKTLLIGIVLLHNVIKLAAQEKNETSFFTFSASYIGDGFANMSGGIKTGISYLGLISLNTYFDTSKAHLWKDGGLFLNIFNTHGGQPTAHFVGDYQGVSNIEASNHTYLYELWYEQKFKKVKGIIGLQDLNVNYAASEYGSLFINSSFGIPSTIAYNIPSPIFPLTALGFHLEWQPTQYFKWKAAIFDGTPEGFENFHLKWKLNKQNGFLNITEMEWNKSFQENRSGIYKIGAYYHNSRDSMQHTQENKGFYFVGDQTVNKHVGIFSQIAASPASKNSNPFYLGLGFNYKGIGKKRQEDVFGLALAYASLKNRRDEATIEMMYQFVINKHISLMPDIQYVINSSGTDIALRNSLISFLRMRLDF
ncbi:MAG: carbohydrate porin [Paludibacteraceae bacterium]|nr:carbohydrate porin [Paludibacteraceae bacterium]